MTPVRIGLLVAALALVGAGRQAWAGCLNLCDITVEPVSAAPALDCLFVRATANSCDCSVGLLVVNNCAGDFQAKGFVFDGCSFPAEPSRPVQSDCATVVPRGNASIGMPLPASAGMGPKAWTFTLSNAGTDVTLQVRAEVSSFGGGGCAYAAPREGDDTVQWTTATLLLLMASGRRQRRSPE